MKTLALIAVTFLSLNAFAGANSLNCSSRDGTVRLRSGEVSYRLKSGAIVPGGFYTSPGHDELGGFDPKDEIVSDSRSAIVVKGSVKMQISSHDLPKDPCGNPGETETFEEAVTITDIYGALLVKTNLKCTMREYSGHCI